MRLSAREFAEWMAYYNLEPWGKEFDAYERALIVSLLANIHRDSKKRPEAYQPQDFMVRFNDRPEKKRAVDLLDKVKVMNRLFGGKDLTRGDAG